MKQPKTALVLHGYKGNPFVNWYLWLAIKLRKQGYRVWSPWLPGAGRPDGRAWTDTLMSRPDFNFDGALIIGHSAGAVQILNLLTALPDGVQAGTVVMVSPFRHRPQWRHLSALVTEPFDYRRLRGKAGRFIIVTAVDDPYDLAEDARFYGRQLGAEVILLPAGGHFNVFRNLRYWRFTELLTILKDRTIITKA